jgi:hypothetical protein
VGVSAHGGGMVDERQAQVFGKVVPWHVLPMSPDQLQIYAVRSYEPGRSKGRKITCASELMVPRAGHK